LSIVALAAKKKGKIRNDILFWLAVIVISASFSFKTLWAEAVFSYKIPVLSTGIANRILFVEAFGLSVLSAFGIYLLADSDNRKRAIKIGLAGGLGIIVLFLNTLITKTSLGAADPAKDPQLYLISLRNMVLPSAVYFLSLILLGIAIRKKGFIKIAIAGMIFISLSQNIYQFRKFIFLVILFV
jgi:hypothetical protein